MSFFKYLLLICMIPFAYGTHLAAIGPVYPIGEENAVNMILRKLKEKEQSGELQKIQQQMVKRAVKSITHMKPVSGIVTTTTRSQRFIDPTVVYTNPIKTPDGRIVIAAGARITPLEHMTLSKQFIFFDGRDPEQCEAVHRLVQKNHLKIKPILIAGSWLNLTRSWKTQVYYDQQGTLTKRFGIRAVPTVISQHQNKLLLDEIPAKELR